MSTHALAMVTLVVPDYDAALDFYVGALGFALVEDTRLSDEKRWVVVEVGRGARLLLARAANDDQAAVIGRQAGGRVGFFLETQDFTASYEAMLENSVTFEEAPRQEAYGRVAVFRDPFGNRWDLIESREKARA